MASDKKDDLLPRLDEDSADFALPDAKRQKKAGPEDATEVCDLSEQKPIPLAEAFVAAVFTDDDQCFYGQVCDKGLKVLQTVADARLVLQELQMATGKIATYVFCEEESEERSRLLLHEGIELLEEAKNLLEESKFVFKDPVAVIKSYIDKVGEIAAQVASQLDKAKDARSENTLPEGLETLHLHLTSFGKKDTISEATKAAVQEYIEAIQKDKKDIQADDVKKVAAFSVEQLLLSNILALESLKQTFKQLDTTRVAHFAAKAPLGAASVADVASVAQPYTEQRYYYITNRKFDSKKGTYSTDIQEQLEYGKGTVRIPTPGMANDNYEVTSTIDSRIQPDGYQAFVTELGRELKKSEVKELFFFIHGYNVEYLEAIASTGQLRDGAKFRGIMVALDWASMGTLANYERRGDNDDKGRVEKSAAPFAEVLTNLLNDLSGVAKAHILAHSMGNFLLCKMVESLVPGSTGSVTSPLRKVATVIHAAADADRTEFTDMLDRLERIKGFSAVRTVYCNDQDLALLGSSILLTQLGARVGFFTRGLSWLNNHVVHPYYYIKNQAVKTVQVTASSRVGVGHSYYVSSPEVLADIQQLLETGQGSESRRKEGKCERKECKDFLYKLEAQC